MKRVLVALSMLALGACAQETVSAPATPVVAPWVDPAQRFSLDYADLGWTILPPSYAEGVVVELEHAVFQERELSIRMCSVRQRMLDVSRSQAELNALLAARTLQEVRGDLRGAITELNVAEVEGIAIQSFRMDASSVQQYWRLFALAHQGQILQVAISCGGRRPLTVDEAANINALLDTLTFLPEASP
jgi:hypothetical protein